MQKKAFVLQNKGMNRDLSVSKADESSAYENRNIRILARDNDTMLSVTSERGTKLIPLEELLNVNFHITEDNELRVVNDGSFRVKGDNTYRSADLVDTLIGWNVLNNHIILFLHKEKED